MIGSSSAVGAAAFRARASRDGRDSAARLRKLQNLFLGARLAQEKSAVEKLEAEEKKRIRREKRARRATRRERRAVLAGRAEGGTRSGRIFNVFNVTYCFQT